MGATTMGAESSNQYGKIPVKYNSSDAKGLDLRLYTDTNPTSASSTVEIFLWYNLFVVQKMPMKFDGIQFKPLMHKLRQVPGYYISECGKILSTKRTKNSPPKLMDYKRNKLQIIQIIYTTLLSMISCLILATLVISMMMMEIQLE